jgi:propionaldehyde dehydrogenase
MEAVGEMMKHPKVNMLVSTGGPGVVKAVLASGKKAIGAGAGNPPVVVDDTADIVKAAKDIVAGASFDNNLPCIAEKEVIALDNICDYLIFQMQAEGALLIDNPDDLRKLEELILSDGEANRDYIGKSAAYILEKAGINHSQDVKLVIVETDASHCFVQVELMMPVLPIVRVKDIKTAISTAVAVEHGYRHTAIMHSKNIDHLSAFGKAIQTTIFVKNGPSYAGIGVGGEGYTTFTIAGPTGEGLTSAKDFTRKRRCVLVDGFNIR